MIEDGDEMICTNAMNAVMNYVEILNNINSDYIRIISLDCLDNIDELKKLYLRLSLNINMIIQTEIDRTNNNIADESRLSLSHQNTGIKKYNSDFNYLISDIKIIYDNNRQVLYNLKLIRNKIEHDLDSIVLKEMFSGSGICGITFSINERDFTLHTTSLKKLILDLNRLFAKIIHDIDIYVFNNDKENYNHPFMNNLRKYRFEKYNEIIESNLLYDFSNFINLMEK